jgi:hypothetical protein
MTKISEINEGELPRSLSALRDVGQALVGTVFGEGGLTVLRKGVTSPEQVRRMQSLLNAFGYNLTVDGIFGDATKMVVIQVQEKMKMQPTGQYDKALDERLRAERDQLGVKSSYLQASDSERATVKAKESALPRPVSIAPSAPPGSEITIIAPSVPPAPKPDASGGGVVRNYLSWVESKWAQLRASPNFMLYAAGAGVVVIGGLGLLWLRSQGKKLEAGPVNGTFEDLYTSETYPLGKALQKSKKRRSKKSKK